MYIRIFLTTLLFVPGAALAQDVTAIEADILVDQEIADEDLTVDVEAEILPSDGFRFVLENALFKVRRAFTFQAERKAEVDQNRLHRLDRKLTACGEAGDTVCVARLEEMITAAEERARRHLERKQEVLGNIEEHFEEWRARRQEHIDKIKDIAAEHSDMREELLERLRAKREEAKEKRDARLEEVLSHRQDRIDRIQTSIEERQQNREHLIEVRSQHVKDRLDTAREQAAEHRQGLEEAQEGILDN